MEIFFIKTPLAPVGLDFFNSFIKAWKFSVNFFLSKDNININYNVILNKINKSNNFKNINDSNIKNRLHEIQLTIMNFILNHPHYANKVIIVDSSSTNYLPNPNPTYYFLARAIKLLRAIKK